MILKPQYTKLRMDFREISKILTSLLCWARRTGICYVFLWPVYEPPLINMHRTNGLCIPKCSVVEHRQHITRHSWTHLGRTAELLYMVLWCKGWQSNTLDLPGDKYITLPDSVIYHINLHNLIKEIPECIFSKRKESSCLDPTYRSETRILSRSSAALSCIYICQSLNYCNGNTIYLCSYTILYNSNKETFKILPTIMI